MAVTGDLAAAVRDLESGAWLEAEMHARSALAQQPDDPRASLLMGLAIAAMGEPIRAAPVLNNLARLQPDAPHPCHDLGNLRRPPPASLIQRQFQACLRLSPDDFRLRLALADLLLEHDQPAAAEALLTVSLPPMGQVQMGQVPVGQAPVGKLPAGLMPGTLVPETLPAAAVATSNIAASRHLIGLAQAEQGHFQPAIASFSAAVAHDPSAAESWTNLGVVLQIEQRFDAAINAHDHAVALHPDNPTFRVNRAVTLLAAGHWESAWRDYEWRLRPPDAPQLSLDRLLPSLAELGDLHGLTILALHEEGFGDTLQFLRYLPLLAERGARVLACVPPPLVRLLAAVPGVAGVSSTTDPLPPHDYVCPFFSLPRAFGTTIDTIPPVPKLVPNRLVPARLVPDPLLTCQWSSRLPRDGLRVGLVWAGQSRPWLPGFRTLDRRRSAGLDVFGPLAGVRGANFVSLQHGPAARQTAPPGLSLFDPMAQVTDFADTAAIIAALDVVVSVDTSIVHLAGLLGKPVFLLDRYDNCWRWLSGRHDSPWYPDLTIFRQQQPDAWAAPVAQVVAALNAMVARRDASGPVQLPDAEQRPVVLA